MERTPIRERRCSPQGDAGDDVGCAGGTTTPVDPAHPELAGKEADEGTLTADSKREQAGAGLDRCTAAELARLRDLNRAYHEKFGFPFVMAVKGRTKSEIFAAIEARLQGQRDEEFRRCLEEIGKIGKFRLTALLGPTR